LIYSLYNKEAEVLKKGIASLIVVLLILMVWNIASAESTTLVYTVKQGDTIWKIAKQSGISMDALLEYNPDLKNEKSLKPGMTLTIPDTSEELIPVDKEVTETHTLIVHGSKAKSGYIAQQDNIMIINGKPVKVPAYKPPARKEKKVVAVNNAAPKVTTSSDSTANYRNRYAKMSSRGFIKGNGIVKAAFKFMGVPYVFGGTTPNGFDCSGFVQYVFRMNGISTPRMAHHQYYAGTPVARSQLQPGDIVFFETYTPGISHCGIYIGNDNFIHASSSGAVKVNSLTQDYYKSRYRGGARYYQ
jgi:cell wall-associated NlpC family hydrolase